jgi:hypothetical protein
MHPRDEVRDGNHHGRADEPAEGRVDHLLAGELTGPRREEHDQQPRK